MEKIDLGILNRKQVDKVIEAVVRSSINMIEIRVLKINKDLSVVLHFLTRKEKYQFDTNSKRLIKELKKLNNPKAWI